MTIQSFTIKPQGGVNRQEVGGAETRGTVGGQKVYLGKKQGKRHTDKIQHRTQNTGSEIQQARYKARQSKIYLYSTFHAEGSSVC